MDTLVFGRCEIPPTTTVDVIQPESDLIIHFQQISRAAALYNRALLGGVKRALEVYRRVDETTKKHPWSVPTTEETWHSHAEGGLTNLNLRPEAWKNARLLSAVPNCRLVLMLAYHMLSPALSVKEAGLMTYLQPPPDAGPSVVQVASGLQNCVLEEDWLRSVAECRLLHTQRIQES